jgi:pyruvate formate lyase activating enzyme
MGKGLVDYIAMDFKAPYDRYGEICGAAADTDKIKQSVQLIMQGPADYEFRTTVVPQLGLEDVVEIAESIKGARLYALQQFRPARKKGSIVDFRCALPPHQNDMLVKMAESVSGLVEKCIIRGSGGVRYEE